MIWHCETVLFWQVLFGVVSNVEDMKVIEDSYVGICYTYCFQWILQVGLDSSSSYAPDNYFVNQICIL
jgi:hypothetical protein